jgi:hypothetical protein
LAAPWKFYNYGGLGFSAVAEPYMNFGRSGVVVYFFGLAYFLVTFERWAGQRPARLAVWAVVLGPLLWTARSGYESFFRPVFWGLAVIFAARILDVTWRRTFGAGRVRQTPPPAILPTTPLG